MIFLFFIGNGGATFTTIVFLEKEYGTKLFDMKILLIHSGGQSQRLPSASILGKIFCPLPIESSMLYQMLDLKLAMYWPFVHKLNSGIFLTCADNMEVYDLEDDSDWSIFDDDFVALAHPSSLKIGRGHGVYVFDKQIPIPRAKVVVRKCLEVLQKPSIEKMFKKKAIITYNDNKDQNSQELVYTDSSFFMSSKILKKMLLFLSEHGPIQCEIDAYGDFLQALGPNATVDYTSHIPNVSNATPYLIATREKVFNMLKGTDLKCIILNSSRFIHIGTTREYIEHFCSDELFQRELGLSKNVFNVFQTDLMETSLKKSNFVSPLHGCILNCAIVVSSHVPVDSILEYCDFEVPINVGAFSIVSNCQYIQNEADDNLDIPENLFLHTVPVVIDGTTKFATIFFDIDENLKKAVDKELAATLPFMDKTVESFLSTFEVDVSRILPVDLTTSVNLWKLKLYTVSDTLTHSLRSSLRQIGAFRQNKKGEICLSECKHLLSIDEILRNKDVSAMLDYRQQLYKKIKM